MALLPPGPPAPLRPEVSIALQVKHCEEPFFLNRDSSPGREVYVVRELARILNTLVERIAADLCDQVLDSSLGEHCRIFTGLRPEAVFRESAFQKRNAETIEALAVGFDFVRRGDATEGRQGPLRNPLPAASSQRRKDFAWSVQNGASARRRVSCRLGDGA